MMGINQANLDWVIGVNRDALKKEKFQVEKYQTGFYCAVDKSAFSVSWKDNITQVLTSIWINLFCKILK